MQLVYRREVQLADIPAEGFRVRVVSRERIDAILVDIEGDISRKACFLEALIKTARATKRLQEDETQAVAVGN